MQFSQARGRFAPCPPAPALSAVKEQKTKEAEYKAENDIIEAVIKNAKVEIPKVMIDDQANEMVYDFEYRLQSQGLSIDTYYKITGSTRKQLIEQYAESAKKQVEMKLILGAIIKAENIEATDADVDAKIAEFATSMGKEVEDYKKSLNDGQIAYLKEQLTMEMAVEFLKANAKYN